ncbi:MAG: T9SS C-terminal target domain-containing protein [Calditrichaeota bacterium]|nr:MAG: T9SS C-terminal target domain-containing protein [Calditrichota bacterium]
MKTLTKTLLTLSIGLTISTNLIAQDKIYFTDRGTTPRQIFKANLDGSNVESIISSGLSSPREIVLDATNSKIYWADQGTQKIQRADLDGSNVEDLVTGISGAHGMAIDFNSQKIYWSAFGLDKIQRADLDGSNVEDIITGLTSPVGIALDLVNSKLYWGDIGPNKIQRSDLDGSNIEDIVTGLHPFYSSMEIDTENSKIYFGEGSSIRRADLDGSNEESAISGLSRVSGIGLDLTNSKIYWTDQNNDKVQRANLDGTNVEDLVSTGLDIPAGIALFENSDAPLSVELNSFQARQIENSIQLTWSTASETENEGFNVYRKTGDRNFIQIASYKSHNELLGQGNTSFNSTYRFVDNSKLQNNELYTYYISDVETNGLETKHEENSQTVKFVLGEENVNTKKEYKLAQNFPNPFNPSTTISYQLAKDRKVQLKIYNLQGELVNELVNEKKNKGSHSVNWNGTDKYGNQVSSGTYFYKLTAGNFTQTNKMILLK